MNEIIKDCRKIYNSNDFLEPVGLDLTSVTLCNKNNITLLRVFEVDYETNKRYIRTAAIKIDNFLLTTNLIDTELFIVELKLFDRGDSNNTYTEIVTKNSIKSLKVKGFDKQIFIERSRAKNMSEIYYFVNKSLNMSYAYEFEVKLTTSGFNYYLNGDKNLIYSYEERKSWFQVYC